MAEEIHSIDTDEEVDTQLVDDQILGSVTSESYNEFMEVQEIAQVLFHWETRRLEKELGTDHPQVLQMGKRLLQRSSLLADFEVERELSTITTPKVETDDALIHGRVSVEDNRGLAKLTVSLEDENGKDMGLAEEIKTDASGYYSIVLTPKKLEKMARAKGGYLVVKDPAGKVLYREENALEMVAGNRLAVNVALKKADLGSTPR